VLGITGDRLERLGDRLKQQGIHLTRILQGEGTELRRQGKDHMTVGNDQQLLLSGSQPRSLGTPLALRTVPIAARIIADLLVATAITLGFVATEDAVRYCATAWSTRRCAVEVTAP
jgi:hypothetical protein